MNTIKITIPGTTTTDEEQQSLRMYFPGISIDSYAIGTLRSAAEPPKEVELSTEDVVVTKFESNIQWIHGGSEFISKLKDQQPPARSASADRLTVPLYWENNNAPSRGIITSALKLLNIHVVKNVAGKAIATEIAHRIEQNNPNILYSCDENFNLINKFNAGAADKNSSRYLLLIHGTGSNTKGGFGGLINGRSNNLYKSLYASYGGKIIAYEHKTFTQSPVQNVLELVQQLPDNVTLDLLTHSRGGLIGEVLARISSEGWEGAFTSTERELLHKNEDASGLVAEIEQLNKLTGKKQLKVNRFIRVACPAAGTTLVSDRADNLLNVLFNILNNIPGEITSTIIDGIKALVTAVVNEKNNTGTLPGIECMKPDSAFIKVLNYSQTKIDSDLVVIAGDAQGEGFVSKLKMMLVDAFYQADNDLVVNTASMKRGTGRTKAFSIFDEQAANVNHFHYFINDSSQKIILQVLTGKTGETRGLYSSALLQSPVPEPAIKEPFTRSAGPAKSLPALYVLPGIMGSDLQVGNDAIWLNYFKIATGGLKRLALSDNDKVLASGINGTSYKKLVDYFSNDYYVIPFSYDWRKSIFDAATELNKSVTERLNNTDQPVSFIVHSMGGLVFRAFVTEFESTWKKVLNRGNCRVLMLGTPNFGSYVVPRLLMGIDKSINSLAALDITSSKKNLLQQFVQYKGLLELLPVSVKDKNDFTTEQTWEDMRNAAGLDYPVIRQEDLAGYRAMQADKFRNYKYDPTIVKYIAGKDDLTPNSFDTADGRLNFYATPKGDGSVTWDTIPEELQSTATYYTDAVHGSLARHEASFEGYRELLKKGQTSRLRTTQPVTRGTSKTELMPDQEAVTLPDENTLQQDVMKIDVPQAQAPAQEIKIFITNGDLGHAIYPVIAGHFKGDGIVEAEYILDRKLNHYLSKRHATNNYPNDIGTHEVIIRKKTSPPGAIVVGLGNFGTLTESNLTQTLKQAFLAYVIKCGEELSVTDNNTQPLGVSYLLIGTGFGGLSIISSIRAVLNAIKETNAFFATAPGNSYQRIGEVEIIELYQYKAIQTGRVILSTILNNSIFKDIVFKPDIIKRASGARNEIPDEMQAGWWHRLKIAQQEEQVRPDGKKVSRGILFSSITDKARSEEVVLNSNISIIDNLIAKSAAVTNNNEKLGQTLYELLVPNDFKGYGSDLRSLVLVLDKETARYPWEMMLDTYSNNNEPIVVKTGFLRQLSTGTYRQNTRLTTANNALVIGNPELNGYYISLPGAAIEAEQVSDRLHLGGYNVKPYTFIESEASDIIPYIYTQPFKIVHIAAHGVLEDKTTGQTGVVLGEALILTPPDFEQMRNIPELVFINCCSLGTIDKADEERLQRKYHVAAGIGTQLIEMGVKAVIVAGWEVDDAAAFCFSDTFYMNMLSGKTYGDAVKEARAITFANYPQKNTWGAYQCYGDPFYSFRSSTGSNAKSYRFCDSIEALNKIQNLVSEIESATSREEKKAIEDEVDCIIKAINEHPEWKQDAAIIEQLANLYKESGDYEKAILYYEQLFSNENADYTVRTIEQYCNVKVKEAVRNFKKVTRDIEEDESKNKAGTEDGKRSKKKNTAAKKTTEREELPAEEETTGTQIPTKEERKAKAAQEASNEISEMIKRLEGLSTMITAERYNLIASAYRRIADVNDDDEGQYLKNLTLAAFNYYQGYTKFFQVYGKVYFYPFYNWLIISKLIGNLTSDDDKKGYEEAFKLPDANALKEGMQAATDYSGERDKIKPDFWNKTTASMQYLLQLILAESEPEIADFRKKIIENHESAWNTEGSVNKQNAISDHAEFIRHFFENHETRLSAFFKLIPEKIEALKSLQSELG